MVIRSRCLTLPSFLLLLAFGWLPSGCALDSGDSESTVGASGFNAIRETEVSAPAQPRVWISHSGRRIVEGSIDEKGYVLPLDIRRPSPPKIGAERISALRIDALRRMAGPTMDVRLGPDKGHTQNETSIAAWGNTVVAGWNQFTDDSVQQGAARSSDGGVTWSHQIFAGHGVASDPVVGAAGGGRWYFGYIATGAGTGGDFEVFVRRSLDDGVTWQDPVPVTVNNSFDDKPYFDVAGDEVLVAYAAFGVGSAQIMASRSLDGGQSFGAAADLTSNAVGGNGACPVITPDGSYYVFWRGSFQEFLWMSKSTDQGATWTLDSTVAPMNPLPASLPPGFRIVNLPSADAHPVNGTLLVVWQDEAFGDADILSTRSTDGGATWSDPIRVNDDHSGRVQFFPWLSFGDDGAAHAVWYDQRGDGAKIDVYLATSEDSGLTWGANQRVTQQAFEPILPFESGAADFIGDYNAVAAAGGRIYPFYQDSREGNQDVWVAVIEKGLFRDGFESGNSSAWGLP